MKKMDLSKVRKSLQRYIDMADENALNYLNDAVTAYQASKSIESGSQNPKSPLQPMTNEDFMAMIDDAERNISSGHVKSQKEVEQLFNARHAGI